MKLVEIYVDGGYNHQSHIGACAAILWYRGRTREVSKTYSETGSSNRMELCAAILGLQALKYRCEVYMYTDSQYVQKGITEWIHNWKAKGWLNYNGKPVANRDLWEQLDRLTQEHTFYIQWVRGHNGNPQNERVHMIVAEQLKTHQQKGRYQNVRIKDTGVLPDAHRNGRGIARCKGKTHRGRARHERPTP